MLAKIKNNTIIQFPYGFDELQADNPYTRFTGIIDIQKIFAQTEAASQGYTLVEVQIEEKPGLSPVHKAELQTTPVLEEGKWILKWVVTIHPPEDCPTCY